MTRFSALFNALIVSASLALAAANASAQMDMHDHVQHNAHAAASQDDEQDDENALAVGEIKKVDKDASKLTVQHGPLTNLGMPGMTMAFKVRNAAMLDQVKAGDKVRLRVERIQGTYTITKLEAAN